MEGVSVSVSVSISKLDNNKENIPPVFLGVETNNSSVSSTIKSSLNKNQILKKKRKLRKPLRDITHLFKNRIPVTEAQILHFQIHSSSAEKDSASLGVNLRKRKAVESTKDSVSKSLRMNFR